MEFPTQPIVSAIWLKENISELDLIILDASVYADRSKNFIENQESIPNALLFDFRKDFVNRESSFPNTIPSPQQFEANCRKLGINKSSIIVVYDNKGVHTSARAWWLFKSMGHQSVYVLNGGLSAWKKEGGTLTNLATKSENLGNFAVSYQKDNIKFYDDIVRLSTDKDYCIIDARSAGRFNGTEDEPRPELKSGRIKNSGNIPYPKVLKHGYYKSTEELALIFSELDLKGKSLIFTCGSGVTACIILLAAELVLENPKSIYDGSWTEWATKQKLFTA